MKLGSRGLGGGSSSFFKGPLKPGQTDDIGRQVQEMLRRLMQNNNPKPLPVPFPPPGEDPQPEEPQPEKQPDTRTDECTGDCEEERKRCPEKTFCFNKTKYIGTFKEPVYDSQLAVQEATMRTMTPTEVLNNRATYESVTRKGLENLKSAKLARSRVISNWQVANPGQSWEALGYQALHRLDMGAGGAPDGYYAMGDGSVNESIGGSWPSRINKLKQHARNLQANNCPLMKVRFDSSLSCVADDIPTTGYPE